MNKLTIEEKNKIRRKRKRIDNVYRTLTILSSLVGVITLLSIFIFVFIKGIKLVNIDLIIGDYYAKEYHLLVEPDEFCNCEIPTNLPKDSVYSSKWGVAVGYKDNSSGEEEVVFTYIDENSPLYSATDLYSDEIPSITVGMTINRISFTDGLIVISKYGPQIIVDNFETSSAIDELYISSDGGGIRGSLTSTVYLIFFSLLFALPLGIFTAIYLNEYAKKGFVTGQLRRLIEMLTGVPSIIFGLVGLVVFIPLTSKFGFTGRNIIASSMTMAIIILPTIIRATEESLKVIPSDLRQASLALGANHTQTTFKVVLPNALSGILTATLLGIGRIVGESAALIFVMGTIINDVVTLDSTSTSLAVQIWSIMGGEVANFELASAISLIILAVVLILNITVKYITSKLEKAWH
ncbi:MAG: phosphate ABC transporter permease PstA [Firmicutes bacterium]|nr:phosphate ABC transporter permease PstA [Bacillota bacterium]